MKPNTKLLYASAAAAVCDTCHDTHRMWFGNAFARVLCTHCPVPCQACQGGNGPYCETTPCSCSCHTPAKARAELRPSLAQIKRMTELARKVYPLRPRCIIVCASPAWADVYDQDAERAVISIRVEDRRLDALAALEEALRALVGQLP